MSDQLLSDLRAQHNAQRDERLHYLEHRVTELERHRDVLAVMLAAVWIAVNVVVVVWEYQR